MDPGPLDDRVRHSRCRSQSTCCGDGGHECGTDHDHHHGAGRWTGGPGRCSGGLGSECVRTPVPLSLGIVGSIGFDAITVALLGRSRPLGIVLAGLLFGALHAGGLAMQSVAQTPLTLTTVLQALIVLFVAAPALVTKIVPFLKPVRSGAWAGT